MLSELTPPAATHCPRSGSRRDFLWQSGGGLGGIAPERRPDIASLGLRAILAATLANLMSAAIAGILIG